MGVAVGVPHFGGQGGAATADPSICPCRASPRAMPDGKDNYGEDGELHGFPPVLGAPPAAIVRLCQAAVNGRQKGRQREPRATQGGTKSLGATSLPASKHSAPGRGGCQ